jgi:hypothetical protein
MWLRRLVALFVAVALVVGAMLLRDRVFGDTGAGSGELAAQQRIVCVRALDDVCAQLGTPDMPAVVEDAATTLSRFAQPEPEVDVWLTVVPWAEIASLTRSAAGLPELAGARSDVLARSPMLVAARADRADALAAACDGDVTWPCLGERAGQPWDDLGGPSAWGTVDVGLDRPATRVDGLLALAQATSAFFDGEGFNSQALADPAYVAWLSELARAVEAPTAGDPFEQLLLTGAATVEFAPVLEATAVPLLRSAPERAEDVALLTLDPTVTADVVAAGYGPSAQAAADAVAEQVADGLTASGWRPPSTGAAPSELASLTLPDGNGVSSAAALEALRRTWMELTR